MYLSLSASVTFTCQFSSDGQTNLFRVILHVFSGTPDSEWYIHPSNKNFERILNSVNSNQSTNLGSQLGYNGFTIDVFKGKQYIVTLNLTSLAQYI